jgi:hypothetical protein
MAVKDIKTPAGLKPILDSVLSGTGFQRAHFVGEAFADRFVSKYGDMIIL